MNIGQVLEIHLGWAADRLGFRAVTPVFDGAKESEIQAEMGRAWMIDKRVEVITERAWDWIQQFEYDPEELEDDDEVRRLYIHEWLRENPAYDPTRLCSTHYARRAVFAEWLREKAITPTSILVRNPGLTSMSAAAATRTRRTPRCACGWWATPNS